MAKFYPYISVEPNLILKTDLPDDHLSGQSFNLYKISNLPSTIKISFEVSMNKWKQAIQKSERGKRTPFDVWIKLDSFSSFYTKSFVLTKKKNKWIGNLSLKPSEFLSNLSIQSFVVRNKDYSGLPDPSIASDKSLILGSSGQWNLNFVQSDFSGSSVQAEWVDFHDPLMPIPFRRSNELFSLDIEDANIKLFFNNDSGRDRNKDIQDITNWEGTRKEDVRDYLNKSIASSMHVSLLTSALMELLNGLRNNPSSTTEDVINEHLSPLDNKIIFNYLKFLYPEYSDKNSRLAKLRTDLDNDNLRKELLLTRCLLAVQAELKLTESLRLSSHTLKNLRDL